MGRWLGIDHGTKRIGVAAGSTDDGIAGPLKVLDAVPAQAAFQQIRRLAQQYGAQGIVVGWPLNMDDTEGPQARLARRAAVQLAEATDLDVRLWDERLSSFEADKALAGQLTRKKRKSRRDALAAASVLHDFLVSGGPDSAPRPGEIGDQTPPPES